MDVVGVMAAYVLHSLESASLDCAVNTRSTSKCAAFNLRDLVLRELVKIIVVRNIKKLTYSMVQSLS